MKNTAIRGTVIALAIAGCGVPAAAQTAPSFGQPIGNQTLDGVIVRYVHGTYELGLRDDNGFLDNVRLHDKTIIFPIGITLELGMRVQILGFNQGTAFTANEIDSPLRGPVPVGQEPTWYAVWDATARQHVTGYRNPPAPAFVNPPAPP
jgi:hypothetical protein